MRPYGPTQLLRITWTEYYFIAGDVSYTQALMRSGAIDGVTQDPVTSRRTLAQVAELCRSTPTIYLPAHDPETIDRLTNRQVVDLARV
jgi:hypothetical protein